MDIVVDSLEDLSAHLLSFFSKPEIDALGKSTRFVQRQTSKLDGFTFLLMNVFEGYTSSEGSLNDRCDWLEEHFGIDMRKQSLDERYNTYAVRFMKQCFLSMLSSVGSPIAKDTDWSAFSGIHITDSTSFKIPAQLRTFYKGFSGKSGSSLVKLHLNYDLLNSSIADIHIGDGSAHDSSYGLASGEQIQPKGLYLRDLGYYSLSHFAKLADAEAYFLSRAKTDTAFYLKGGDGLYEPLDLISCLGQADCLDLPEVYLGKGEAKVRSRLVMERVPQEVASKRLERLRRYASKHKGSVVSEQRKAMCHFNVFITNAPASILPTQMVRLAYSLRWQVEIIFKIWKSHYDIDKVGQMNIFRFECHLYARLIAILMDYAIQGHLSHSLMDVDDFETSPIKASKLIKKKPPS